LPKTDPEVGAVGGGEKVKKLKHGRLPEKETKFGIAEKGGRKKRKKARHAQRQGIKRGKTFARNPQLGGQRQPASGNENENITHRKGTGDAEKKKKKKGP